jgi:hypothetical protein
MLVKKLGGEISLESKEKEGSTFTFTVKLNEQQPEILIPQKETEEDQISTSGREEESPFQKILIDGKTLKSSRFISNLKDSNFIKKKPETNGDTSDEMELSIGL